MSNDEGTASSGRRRTPPPGRVPVSRDGTQASSSAQHATEVSRRAALGFVAVAALVLLGSGVGFRLGGRARGTVRLTEPRVGLDTFPREFCGYEWSRDLPLDKDTEEVLGAMYYLNRQGFRRADSAAASLWVSYFGSPETRVDHEPQRCMRNGGWTLPFNFVRIEIPMPPRENGDPWRLPIQVYLFKKDMDHLLMVNTYCVNGTYLNKRTAARILSLDSQGLGFYTQTRVTINLTTLEWSELVGVRGPEGDPYALARDVDGVARAVRELESSGPTPGEKVNPYLRAVEIMRHVIPHLERHLPIPGELAAERADP